MKKYFEFKDSISNKSWEINLKKNQVFITFGRIGIKNPVCQLKKFNSNEEAKKYIDKKIREKINKVYVEKNKK